MEWYERLAQESLFAKDPCCLMAVTTARAYSPLFYVLKNGEAVYDDTFLTSRLSRKIDPHLSALTQQPGIHLFRYADSQLVQQQYIPHYNVELDELSACELILHQVCGISPAEDARKQALQKSLKAEKIKATLAYACYVNDTDAILTRAASAKPAELDKPLKGRGTPLCLAAEHNNAHAFKAIAACGADVGKRSLGFTPLETAFINNARDVARCIQENYPDQFAREAEKKGFLLAYQTTDETMLQMLLDFGCDINCAGKQFPPLHNFVDYGNLNGIRFLAEHGANLCVKNKDGQTALERAAQPSRASARKLLLSLMKNQG